MERGSSLYFGSLPGATTYFSRYGFSCPPSVTPTDFFLQISDKNFSFKQDVDFRQTFLDSPECKELVDLVDSQKNLSPTSTVTNSAGEVPFWFKVYVLVYREYALAYRDPTLYYFQVVMLMSFAFFTGAVFWDLPYEVDGNFNIILSGPLWIVLCYSWTHAFKVYYLSSGNKRAVHEIFNAKYPVSAVLLSDTIATATLAFLFAGVSPVAFFMMGFPAKAFPFILAASWLVRTYLLTISFSDS